MRLIQLVYVSRPFGYDTATLNGILLDARRLNTRDDITGALICRQDIFLQLLEGPETTVLATFERIRADDRHVEVRQVINTPVKERLFGDWAMLHDPEKSWIWTQQDIRDGILDRLTPADFQAVFADLAAKVVDTTAG